MPVKAKPLTRFQLSSLPKESRLSFMEKMKLSSTLRNWNKEGTDFYGRRVLSAACPGMEK